MFFWYVMSFIMNRLLFGDNLKWLQDHKLFPDASVDLVYLDPPFNSNADYNVLFKETSGEASQAQFHAFTDTWSWADAAETYNEFLDTCPNIQVVDLMQALHSFLKTSPMMAYLAMMAPRLVELHRVLKPTGSLYLHCDPTASHYLRMLWDGIFAAKNFRNEVVWERFNFHADAKRWGRLHDVILYYTKDFSLAPFETQRRQYEQSYIQSHFKQDEGGRWFTLDNPVGAGQGPARVFFEQRLEPPPGTHWRYSQERIDRLCAEGRIVMTKTGRPRIKRFLDEMAGHAIGDVWTDIPEINSQAKERLGFPTQKPQALLERIIEASSNPGELVLDPFCGCGTTIHAAQKLGRHWIGIDITYLAINLIKRRLRDAFGKKAKFEERGQPTDFESAKRLAELDKFQFQQWALSLIEARPLKEGAGKGADRGVDGLLYFYETKTERAKILVQVKGGGVKRSDIVTLLGDVNNQKAAAGVLLTLEKPTKPMREEAAEAGRYVPKLYPSKNFPKIQILTIESVLSGKERLDAPPQANIFAKAGREGEDVRQEELL